MNCPACGGDTRVAETRAIKIAGRPALRRRRWCLSTACGHRQATYEAYADVAGGAGPVLVPRSLLIAARKIAAILNQPNPIDEEPPTTEEDHA